MSRHPLRQYPPNSLISLKLLVSKGFGHKTGDKIGHKPEASHEAPAGNSRSIRGADCCAAGSAWDRGKSQLRAGLGAARRMAERNAYAIVGELHRRFDDAKLFWPRQRRPSAQRPRPTTSPSYWPTMENELSSAARRPQSRVAVSAKGFDRPTSPKSRRSRRSKSPSL